MVQYLSSPELRPLIQALDESRRQPDIISNHGFVMGEPVDGTNAAAQVSVDHGGQFTVPELRQELAG